MIKFISGVFVGALLVGLLAKSTIGEGIGNVWLVKYDCEKTLPRDKECVMVFDFVPVEADYE